MSEVKLPPGPRFAAWETLKLMREPYGYYERMKVRYGRLFTVPSLNSTVVVYQQPEA